MSGGKTNRLLFWTGLTALLVINAVFLYWNAFRTFKFFDMGSHLDMAWRLSVGQKPHVDFLSYTGPVHFYLSALFIHLLGFSKAAIWTHLVVVNSAVIGLIAWMLWKKCPLLVTWLVAALGMVSFYWTYSHPWYTQSAHLWALAAVAVLTVRKETFTVGLFTGAMATLSFFTKTNVGVLYVSLFFIYLCAAENRKKTLSGYFAGIAAALLALKILFIPSLGAAWEQMLAYGLSQKGRALEILRDPSLWFANYYWAPALLVTLSLWKRVKKSELLLLYGLWAVAILSTFTSGAVAESDVQVTGFYFAMAFVLLYKYNAKKMIKILTGGMAFSLIILYTVYAVELKQWSVAEIMTFNNQRIDPRGDYELKSGGLKGWKVKKEQGEAVDGLVEFIQNNVPKDESLIVLTDLQILYPLTGRDSYRGIPWIFTIDQSPAPGKQLEEFRQKFLSNEPLWVVTHRGRVAYITGLLSYLGIMAELRRDYVLAGEFGNYLILRKKF